MKYACINAQCRSSVLRRKVQSAYDTDLVDLHLTIHTQAREFNGPWLATAQLSMRDSKGQEQWVTLPHEVLMAIVASMKHVGQDVTFVPLDPSIVEFGT